jgi:parvulin-like peptidyl-prolyl isomerase
VALVLLPVVGVPAQNDPDRRTDFIAAKVNEDLVTSYEVMKRIEPALREISANDLLSPAEKRQQRKSLWQASLREIVEERLLLQAAEKVGATVDDARVQARIDAEASRVGGMENLLKILSDEGIDLTEFQDSFRRQLTTQQLLLRKFGLAGGKPGETRSQIDLFITPTEIREFYLANLDHFLEPARVKIRQIILFPAKMGSVEEAEELARSLTLQLRQGAEFAELARTYSHGPRAAGGGAWPTEEVSGEMVWTDLRPGTARPEIERAAFALEAGEVSEPLQVDLGGRMAIFIVQVVESVASHQPDLRDVQDSIRESLYEKRFVRNVRRIKRQLLRDAYIWPPDLYTTSEGTHAERSIGGGQE